MSSDKAGYVHLASLSTPARPGAEFRRRQALAFVEAVVLPAAIGRGRVSELWVCHLNPKQRVVLHCILNHEELLESGQRLGCAPLNHNPTHQWAIELTRIIKKTVWSDDSTNTSSHLVQKRLPIRTLGMLRNKEAWIWRNLIFKPEWSHHQTIHP